MVGQQRLVNDGDLYTLPRDAARLQGTHAEAGVPARFQQGGGFVLGPHKDGAVIEGVGVEIEAVVFARLVGLLLLKAKLRHVGQVVVGSGVACGAAVGASVGEGAAVGGAVAAGTAVSAAVQAVRVSASRQAARRERCFMKGPLPYKKVRSRWDRGS